MLTIYHTPPTRSMRVVWLAEELGIPYETVSVAFGGPYPEGFMEVSPLGQLPAIKDGDVAMTESIAIMQYLLAKHGPTPLAVTPSEPGFSAYLQYLEFGEAGLCAMGNANVATRFLAPKEEQRNWTSRYIGETLKKRMGVIEARLADGRQYMAADRFTAADISVGFGIGAVKFFGAGEVAPAVETYFERLTARPAYQRAAAVK
jgi:glutathione S-transferase